MEAALTLATIIPRWRLSAVSEQRPSIDTTITYRIRDGFPMRLQKRCDKSHA